MMDRNTGVDACGTERGRSMKIRSSLHAARLAILAILVASPSSLLPQSFTGSVSGTVTDATGGVLPKVKVTLINEKTNEARTQ